MKVTPPLLDCHFFRLHDDVARQISPQFGRKMAVFGTKGPNFLKKTPSSFRPSPFIHRPGKTPGHTFLLQRQISQSFGVQDRTVGLREFGILVREFAAQGFGILSI